MVQELTSSSESNSAQDTLPTARLKTFLQKMCNFSNLQLELPFSTHVQASAPKANTASEIFYSLRNKSEHHQPKKYLQSEQIATEALNSFELPTQTDARRNGSSTVASPISSFYRRKWHSAKRTLQGFIGNYDSLTLNEVLQSMLHNETTCGKIVGSRSVTICDNGIKML